jgi:hypothetical protein
MGTARVHGKPPNKRKALVKTTFPASISKMRMIMMVPVLAALMLIDQPGFAQNPNSGDLMNSARQITATQENQEPMRRCFAGTSLFSLYDFLPDSPEFLQLDLGYWLTRSDIILLEAITWKYSAPTGIYAGSGAGPEYPGYVRSYGISVAYQCFLWNGLFAQVHASSFLQDYRDTEGKEIQKGFQLMLQFRLGYRLACPFLGKRLYIEPNADCNYWPLDQNAPASFADTDSHYMNFAFEPGLNIGLEF